MAIETNPQEFLSFESLRGLRAEAYVRDSTRDQRDGFGPEIQRTTIEQFAESYQLALGTRWYTEFVSGRRADNRPQFQLLLEDARLDRFDVLLVHHTSRFGRNQEESIRYKTELLRLGKVVVFTSQGIISGTERDFINERINETMDEAYSRTLSKNVTAGFAEKAARGFALGNAPLGYRIEKAASGRGARLVPNPETMPVLLTLLRSYASGDYAFRSLARHLNAQGFRTTRGLPFTQSSITNLLSNRIYEGKVPYRKGRADEQVIDGAHEVPPEVHSLWNQCQEVRRARMKRGRTSPRSRQHRVYIFTGVLICDKCGLPYHGHVAKVRGSLFPRMEHSLRRCGIKGITISAKKIEREFVDRILPYLSLDDEWRGAVLSAMANEGPEPDLTAEIGRIDLALGNLRKQHMWGHLPDGEFRSAYVDLERERNRLDVRRTPIATPNLDRAAELLMDLPALWEHPGVKPEQRRELAREIFDEIRMRDGGLVAIKPKPEYAPLFAYSLMRSAVAGGNPSP